LLIAKCVALELREPLTNRAKGFPLVHRLDEMVAKVAVRSVEKQTDRVKGVYEAEPIVRPDTQYRELDDHAGSPGGRPRHASGRPNRSGCGDERRHNRLCLA
jgi:hypothetical protein